MPTPNQKDEISPHMKTSLDAEIKEAHAYGRDALKALLYVNSTAVAGLVAIKNLHGTLGHQVNDAIVSFGVGAILSAVASLFFFAIFYLYVRDEKMGDAKFQSVRTYGAFIAMTVSVFALLCSLAGVLLLAKAN